MSTIPTGTRVRIVGAPDWSSWKRPSIGDTGTIVEPPRVLVGAGPIRCGLMWFEVDSALRNRVHTDQFVRAHEVEPIG